MEQVNLRLREDFIKKLLEESQPMFRKLFLELASSTNEKDRDKFLYLSCRLAELVVPKPYYIVPETLFIDNVQNSEALLFDILEETVTNTEMYKQAIKIGSNVTDMMKLPCVTACHKLNDKCGLEWLEYEISLGDHKEHAEEGDWLCEDCEGHWTVLTDDVYNNLNQNN